MGANNGTGWPLSFWCAICRKSRGFGKNRHDAPGRDVVRTGRTRPYKGGARGARGLNTFHEYTCSSCGHTGWSRHVDIAKKPLKDTGWKCVRPDGCFRPACIAEKRCRMDPSHPRFALYRARHAIGYVSKSLPCFSCGALAGELCRQKVH